MFDNIKQSCYKISKRKHSSAPFTYTVFLAILFFVIMPVFLFSQVFPDSTQYKKAIKDISQNSEIKLKSNKSNNKLIKLSAGISEQCVGISTIIKDHVKKKLLIFWQKDSIGKWVNVTFIFATDFKFIDIDGDQVYEIECIDKEGDKNRRVKDFKLISIRNGEQLLIYSYHQVEYYNPDYIISNFAPDSVFSVKHNLLIKDIDWDGKPELTDNIEIKYRKLPCCDHHFEYGIRQKKLVLRLINGKFESE
jgi:hypothetical protein